ncbi:hypothetical protein B8W69_19825 [Mycobacterium vulneris]|uniref:Uncharacterized protein n=1 Tax=Mycolicibacterium vulneris TaxID=547163 RepID=A0A1X2KTS1_9MYCO|nr:hypothetical protein [Mycolicibacterium vulneris]OSC25176.1 hypothetical protein B8W69_19825 [Mycolicibacterium vulneris]
MLRKLDSRCNQRSPPDDIRRTNRSMSTSKGAAAPIAAAPKIRGVASADGPPSATSRLATVAVAPVAEVVRTAALAAENQRPRQRRGVERISEPGLAAG